MMSLTPLGEELPVDTGPTYMTYTPTTTSTEHSCLHKGYLYKRGALLKGWKQRWFILDSTKHQVWADQETTHYYCILVCCQIWEEYVRLLDYSR